MEHSKRIYSLDVFRGATIAAMILVNNAGSYDYVYPQLLHAEWHGWTFTDWIFPFFLFMVGMSMVFSFESRLKRGDTHQQILRHSLKRLLILFALGLFINGFPFGLIPGSQFSIATWRILGVLQRIGICYFFTSLIYLNVKPKGQWLWIGILLGIYWFALKVIPV
ncbi:MAG TPA: heparan-alpha-glucosaminide N-acetyltransferase domain-containing protein, partial [Candidatus Marinimicrobia bacterium]|nr:heparan-alpha-glucosaminide N-acetyltransferase domain-containing protein [Candidatus Neomarinimicrobiota bacterium]